MRSARIVCVCVYSTRRKHSLIVKLKHCDEDDVQVKLEPEMKFLTNEHVTQIDRRKTYRQLGGRDAYYVSV